MIDHTIRTFDTNGDGSARLDGEQIADAIDALVKRDTNLAERVIARDDSIDALQRARKRPRLPLRDGSRWLWIYGR
jgi:hypothetical protein